MGFFRQEYWRGLAFPSPGDLPDPGMEPESSVLQADSSPCEPLWKPLYNVSMQISLHLFCLQFIWLPGSEDSCLSSVHHSHLSLHIVSAPLFHSPRRPPPGILIRHVTSPHSTSFYLSISYLFHISHIWFLCATFYVIFF